jgi:hypothetical protein
VEVSKQVIRNIACLAIVLGAAVGCGPKTDRLPISGKVTLNGVPLDSGSIRFNSQPGEKLQSAGAMIHNGVYEIPAEQGLLPGIYVVEMSSPDAKAPPIMVGGEDGGPKFPVAPDRIPPEFNSGDGNKIELSREGDTEFNFEVSSSPKK